MEVQIVSREMIKPSTLKLDHLKPYSLCLFDQLTPSTYAPLILFYTITDHPKNSTSRQTLLAQLKISLSGSLSLYYPLSGRTKNNLFIDDFSAGLPFFEARINCTMSKFVKLNDIQLLNKFLPFHPFCKETDHEPKPNLAFQVNFFTCGSVALAVSLCHKASDGGTINLLLQSWAAIFRGSLNQVTNPNLAEASLAFPPRITLPENYAVLMDRLWFKEASYVTRRFVFSPKSITALREKAKSERVPKPSRSEALTGFIWKHTMAASRTISGSLKTSILAQAVNMRSRMSPHLNNATGNLFWWAAVAADQSEVAPELNQLVELMSESLAGFDAEYLMSLKGEEGFKAVSEYFDQLEQLFSLEEPDVFAFTNWTGFFTDIDFGWGSPYWVAVMGQVGPKFRNLTIFTETKWSGGIEAWITLDAKKMAVLEKDPAFLAFASPNPSLSSL